MIFPISLPGITQETVNTDTHALTLKGENLGEIQNGENGFQQTFNLLNSLAGYDLKNVLIENSLDSQVTLFESEDALNLDEPILGDEITLNLETDVISNFENVLKSFEHINTEDVQKLLANFDRQLNDLSLDQLNDEELILLTEALNQFISELSDLFHDHQNFSEEEIDVVVNNPFTSFDSPELVQLTDQFIQSVKLLVDKAGTHVSHGVNGILQSNEWLKHRQVAIESNSTVENGLKTTNKPEIAQFSLDLKAVNASPGSEKPITNSQFTINGEFDLSGKNNTSNANNPLKSFLLNSGQHQESMNFISQESRTTNLMTPSTTGFTAPVLGESTSRIQMPVQISFGHSQWANQVAERSAMMVYQNVEFAELQLDPPELGPLQVRVSVQNESASVSFVAANASVKEALEQTAIRLKELLEEQSLNLVDVNVSDQSSQDSEKFLSQSASSEQLDEQDEELTAKDESHTYVANYGVDHYA